MWSNFAVMKIIKTKKVFHNFVFVKPQFIKENSKFELNTFELNIILIMKKLFI